MAVVEAFLWLIAIMAASFWYVWLHRWQQQRSQDPKTWPLFGAQWEAMANMHRLHCWIHSFFSSTHRTVTLRTFAGRKIYLTVDPLNVYHILKGNFQNYPKGERVHSVLHDFLGNGIFNADGEMWKKHRKIASFEFSNRKLKQMSIATFRHNALRLLSLLDERVPSRQPLDLQDLFFRMTMDSLCQLIFGIEGSSLSPPLAKIPFASTFDNINDIIIARLVNPFWKIQRAFNIGNERIIKQNLTTLNNLIVAVLEERRKATKEIKSSEERCDLLSQFMRYNGCGDGKYSDDELRDFIINFMVAGRDTTAVALSWFVYCLCRHPHVVEQIQMETLDALGLDIDHDLKMEDFAMRLDYESLMKMQYLHAALSECLRLYPPVPRDGKTVLKDDVLPDGTFLEKGSQISYVPYSMGRLESLWGPDALEYKPERWLKDGVFQHESPFKFPVFQVREHV
ncbi:hypothetical protein KP509_34G003200 [Ceratopteris richardii]|uniref:Cytochrome P450 n=1 Tax=Ceratopteris richardii TaxID=49495 RepID=A0A8T2QHJ9_CERRI|nr:hypothetical protein KP509_34G003200 [Ceratopteris richardii]